MKDIFKTSKGKYVAPSPIEMKLSVNKNIEQVCVVGDSIPQPIALVVLSDRGKIKKEVDIFYSLSTTLDSVNDDLDPHEKIHNIIILDSSWTIENKLITPTMKIKRNNIEKMYRKHYNTWYTEKTISFVE